MNALKRTHQKAHQTGVTLVEILIALGLVVVIISFATPSFSNVTAKAELKAAVENMEFSIHIARNMARQMNTDVIMHLESDRNEKSHSVWYSIPANQNKLQPDPLLQTYHFPETVRLVTTESNIRFDFRGAVEAPVQLMLVSNQDDEINQRLLVE